MAEFAMAHAMIQKGERHDEQNSPPVSGGQIGEKAKAKKQRQLQKRMDRERIELGSVCREEERRACQLFN